MSVYSKVLDFLQSYLPFHNFYIQYMLRLQSTPLSKMFWSWNTSFDYDCWEGSWDCRQTTARANNPVIICLFKFNNKINRTFSEISFKITITIPEGHHCHCSTVFIVNFEQISHCVFVFYCWFYSGKHWLGKTLQTYIPV